MQNVAILLPYYLLFTTRGLAAFSPPIKHHGTASDGGHFPPGNINYKILIWPKYRSVYISIA